MSVNILQASSTGCERIMSSNATASENSAPIKYSVSENRTSISNKPSISYWRICQVSTSRTVDQGPVAALILLCLIHQMFRAWIYILKRRLTTLSTTLTTPTPQKIHRATYPSTTRPPNSQRAHISLQGHSSMKWPPEWAVLLTKEENLN